MRDRARGEEVTRASGAMWARPRNYITAQELMGSRDELGGRKGINKSEIRTWVEVVYS